MKIILLGANVQIKGQKCYIGREKLLEMIQERGHSLTVIGNVSSDLCREMINKIGVKYKQVELGNSILNLFQQLKVIRNLSKIFKNEKPKMFIVYSVQRIPSTVIAAKIAKIDKINVVINGAGRLFQNTGVKGDLLRAVLLPILKYCLKQCEYVFFQNKDDKKMFIDMKLVSSEKAIHVNGSGVDTMMFEPKPIPKITTFLMVARLLREKGVVEYLKAARFVKKKYPEVKFVLAGPLDYSKAGIPREELEDYIFDQSVEYVGEVINVKDYYSNCSVFVLPSYYREGIPRTILEAMATARPILTTNSSGCRETVINGENGFLVPIKDVNSLAEKMIWMIEHNRELERMGEKSREICVEKYDVIKVNEIMLSKMGL